MSDRRIVIIGAGPCGLGAAATLEQAGSSFIVLEKNSFAGGLCASFTDDRGFVWDTGGHVVVSRYGPFRDMVDSVLGADKLFHKRRSFVQAGRTRVTYPIQNNLWQLESEKGIACLLGMKGASRKVGENFDAWLESTYGKPLCELFMKPYNRKVWSYDIAGMSSSWATKMLSVPEYKKSLASFVHRIEDGNLGPNAWFLYPLRGGTGEIFRRLAGRLAGRIRFGSAVSSIDAACRKVRLADGGELEYEAVISTVPICDVVGMLTTCPEDVSAAAGKLVFNTVFIAGFGLERPHRDDFSWMYFPGGSVPFYRVTNFSGYSPYNVPDGETGRFSSLLCEVSMPAGSQVDDKKLYHKCHEGLIHAGLLEKHDCIVSRFVLKVEKAYPVPTVDRDENLAVIQEYLAGIGIQSTGRSGAWVYEDGYMDDAYMMGRDAAGSILDKDAVHLCRK